MDAKTNGGTHTDGLPHWPADALTRIPFWIYQSPGIYAQEQQRVYEGPVWSYLCLAAEVPEPGDYRTSCIPRP